jgi:dimethylglycine catabolism A
VRRCLSCNYCVNPLRAGERIARSAAFETYVRELERACRRHGVRFRCRTEASPALLGGFDRVVLATGARYRLRAGPLVRQLLDAGAGKTRVARRLFARPEVRSWFYYCARSGTSQQALAAVPRGLHVVVIGDAGRAGTAREAVATAFRAALLAEDRPGAQMSLPAAQPPST